ncbi:uncharacterized protein TrAtP1_008780 [Trichoderma atroviride]|uniref:uncharacterized protein n=1 Tax=Hypocrea atroviridis TaxID=63577 RepID=UPI00331A4FD8|nr:hypothetical protein TrAtP1_008780 [Trichoderma atroviride]
MGPPGFEMRNMTRERCDMNEEKYAASWGVYRAPSRRLAMLGGFETGALSWGRARVRRRFPARATLSGWALRAVHDGRLHGVPPAAVAWEQQHDASSACGWMAVGGLSADLAVTGAAGP